MSADETDQTTILLRRMSAGDSQAAGKLVPLVYDELHRIADRLMRGQRSSHTLQPTALINEAFLKLVRGSEPGYEDRRHFMRVATRAMRSVVIDYARAAASRKRGDGRRAVTLQDDLAWTADEIDQALAVHEGIEALSTVDGRLAEIVELRFFGGFGNQEIAELLEMSLRSVERGWQFSRSWLKQHFEREVEAG